MSPFSKDYAPVIQAKEIRNTSRMVKRVDPHINTQVLITKKETSQERADKRKKLERSNSFC